MSVMEDSLELTLKPEWDELNIVRERLEHFLTEHQFSVDDIHALIMVSSELVENAIKYENSQNMTDKFEYSVDIEGRSTIVEVRNRILGNDDLQLKKLDETIQWIRGYQNPFEAYVERLKLISAKELGENESGLGLTRIAYEGSSVLDFYVDENNVLAMSAVYQR